ncbi:MAG: hypothetical protein Q8867_11190, partial [Bacteroidota bacterium]|nr:hypothetical protein [Bacteroidota bacterium]
MKKTLLFVLTSLSFIGIYCVLIINFPKNTGVIPFLIILLFANVYLWTYVHDCIRRYRKSLYLLTASLYWLPLATFYGMVITGFFYPFTQWNIPARAYLSGTIVITLAIMAIPAAFLTINDIIRISRYSINFFHHRPEAKWQNFPRNSVAMNVSWILA